MTISQTNFLLLLSPLQKKRGLYWFHFGFSALSGAIPSEFGHMAYLLGINLEHNQLTGSVRPSFAFRWFKIFLQKSCSKLFFASLLHNNADSK